MIRALACGRCMEMCLFNARLRLHATHAPLCLTSHFIFIFLLGYFLALTSHCYQVGFLMYYLTQETKQPVHQPTMTKFPKSRGGNYDLDDNTPIPGFRPLQAGFKILRQSELKHPPSSSRTVLFTSKWTPLSKSTPPHYQQNYL